MTIEREEAKELVRETLRELGVDPDEFTDMQRDFAYLRRMRVGSEQTTVWIRRTCIGAFVSGGIWLLWEAFKAALGR